MYRLGHPENHLFFYQKTYLQDQNIWKNIQLEKNFTTGEVQSCMCSTRYVGYGTLKIVHFYYEKKCFLDQSIQNIFIYF